jgi:hypothetical protein
MGLHAWAGRPQATFPSRLPLVQLDHVFARGLRPVSMHRCRRAHLVANVGPSAADCRVFPAKPRDSGELPEPKTGHHLRCSRARWSFLLRWSGRLTPAARSPAGDLYLQFDASGEQVAQALGKGGQRGVAVFLVMDGVGTPTCRLSGAQRLDAAGVHWRIYSRVGTPGVCWFQADGGACIESCVWWMGRSFFVAASTCWTIGLTRTMELDAPRFDFAVQVRVRWCRMHMPPWPSSGGVCRPFRVCRVLIGRVSLAALQSAVQEKRRSGPQPALSGNAVRRRIGAA